MRFWACPFYSYPPPFPCSVFVWKISSDPARQSQALFSFCVLFCFLTRVKLADRHVPDAYRQLSWLQVLTIINVTWNYSSAAPETQHQGNSEKISKMSRTFSENVQPLSVWHFIVEWFHFMFLHNFFQCFFNLLVYERFGLNWN